MTSTSTIGYIYGLAMADRLPLSIIDAFVDGRPFSGNPAAVVLLDEPRPDSWMQGVASEMNLSETAFLLGTSESSVDPAPIGLRWFTPTVEVDLCGHATLASAHLLYQRSCTGRLSFDTRSGILGVDPGADGSLVLDFPARPPEADGAVLGLSEALGTVPVWVGRGGDDDLFVEVDDERTVRALVPDIAKLSSLPARGIIVTALCDGSSGYDVVTRFFAPSAGVAEDPVTGSAHTAVGPYWAERLGRDELVGYQASARGGVIRMRVAGDRVHLGGYARTVVEGWLSV